MPTFTDPSPWVANCGQAFAEQLHPEPGTVCVSITGAGYPEALLCGGWVAVHRVAFDDVEADNERLAKKYRPISRQQAAAMSRFLRLHRGRNILVHCAAGVSRSGGVVEAILMAFPEYIDRGWRRYPNRTVKTLLLRALGVLPIGAGEED